MTRGPTRRYRYVGPPALKATVRPGAEGRRITSARDFDTWIGEQSRQDLDEPFTFTIDLDGVLRLAPRRSEHITCAAGQPVLSAGEIGFTREPTRWIVPHVSNHSTGYCPDTTSWPHVAEALEHAGLTPPPGFTHELHFRRCPGCSRHNIVRDADYTCVFCETALPTTWNIDPADDTSTPH
ncbi:hypothetical protein LX16_4879 [Stackebrandtia albiflava]|uniref:Uncharacterized protein n=1 Tax=Stackebrandtia albiflava TaxID=406432 RepID=A0A562UQ31_9ACTN|nr:hypothetical protein [Stackebrandtia albiflava]TWJ07719.1 hypothetical protein LX16_4879 [Stackebrandtia albiflava]